MIIETQNTPDENILNFFPPQQILPKDQTEFIDSKSLRKSPLAEKIFDLGSIESIFITSDMISVTKKEQGNWKILKPQILAEIMDFITSGENIIIPTDKTKHKEEIIQSVTSLLNARIRPAIQKDGGDVQFLSFEDGIVYVKLLGNCSGCPYATRTLKDGIEKILQTYIPEVKEVRNISEKE